MTKKKKTLCLDNLHNYICQINPPVLLNIDIVVPKSFKKYILYKVTYDSHDKKKTLCLDK